MKKLKPFIWITLVGLVLVFFNMPVFNYGYYGLPFLLLLLTLLWMVVTFPASSLKMEGKELRFEKNTKFSKTPFWVVLGLAFYVVVLPFITSSPMFHSRSYRNLIGSVKTGSNLSQHMAPISLEKIRVVDQSLASLLGDKVLGAQPALGSQVEVGTFNIQKVRDELYWVAPLVHSGFFKWMSNREGTPGYVMVSATNERDVKLVQKMGSEDVRIKIQQNAYFFDDLERHLYFSGHITHGLTDYSFEIDDNGRPFWVISKYAKRIGFSGEDVFGILVVDAKTGQISEYDITNAPKWVDRIQPQDFVMQQLNDWGEYVNGYWNFSNENKLQATESPLLVYGEDNKSYWYTGLTSVGRDESTNGFVLVDTRTKKAHWYRQSGATEFAAQNSAVGKVQEKGYSASQPIPYNINNIPTYVMTLKDNGGLVKMHAMVAIGDYTIVGTGNSLRESLMAYKSAYNMAGNKINPESISNRSVTKSVLTRISSDIKNGNSFYYFTVKDLNRIFVGSSQLSNELPISVPGDSVEISFDNDAQEIVDVVSFNNKKLGKQ
ncbi:MAG TPA: hypothetical protein PLL64_06265 [Rhodothermales bacterium]|nr:hypothetical protein [Rhodothermales bacterium]HRR08657.1 hypothetical protein [Rhodothermales bacterium]